ncbi:MAG: GxxExxY protein [Longimicrobiales bacterium]
MKPIDTITGQVIDASIGLHMRLGPGLLESVYEVLLARELQRRNLSVERQKPIVFEFDGVVFNEGLRVDLLVDEVPRRPAGQLRSRDPERGSAPRRQRLPPSSRITPEGEPTSPPRLTPRVPRASA